MQTKPIPWGKLPGLAVWLALVFALACMLRAGLESLDLPGFEDFRVKWLFALGLSASESVLIERFRRTGNGWLLAAAAAMIAAAVGIEFVNLSNVARRDLATVAQAGGAVEIAREGQEAALARLAAAEARLETVTRTRAVWERDGDGSNDGALQAAREGRERAAADLALAEGQLAAANGAARGKDAARGALCDAPAWLIIAGLVLVKAGVLALAWSLGDKPEGRGGGGEGPPVAPTGRTSPRELGGNGGTNGAGVRSSGPKRGLPVNSLIHLARETVRARRLAVA